jgi:hypothetical protein
MDVHERIGTLVASGVPQSTAEIAGLEELGYASWEAYAAVLGACVRARIEAAALTPPTGPLTGPLERYWPALAKHSLAFLASPWWPLACRSGWSLMELFGLAFETKSGARLSWPRFRNADHAVPWWEMVGGGELARLKKG